VPCLCNASTNRYCLKPDKDFAVRKQTKLSHQAIAQTMIFSITHAPLWPSSIRDTLGSSFVGMKENEENSVQEEVNDATQHSIQFTQKLKRLNDSQQGIQTLSQWVLFHKKFATKSVDVWRSCFEEAADPQKLTLIYLCNDIVQNSRKLAPLFTQEFANILPACLNSFYSTTNPTYKSKIQRMIDIWDDRCAFSKEFISHVRTSLSLPPTSNPASLIARSKRPRPTESKESAKAATKEPPKVSNFDSISNSKQIDHPLVKVLYELHKAAKNDKILTVQLANLPFMTQPESDGTSAPQKEHQLLKERIKSLQNQQHLRKKFIALLTKETETQHQLIAAAQDAETVAKSSLKDASLKLVELRAGSLHEEDMDLSDGKEAGAVDDDDYASTFKVSNQHAFMHSYIHTDTSIKIKSIDLFGIIRKLHNSSSRTCCCARRRLLRTREDLGIACSRHSLATAQDLIKLLLLTVSTMIVI
jgi:hypothetical protein